MKLQIGEFSKLCGVTVKTLRHYEKLGLLRPSEVDEWSGYRYYRPEQLQTMQTILGLKEVGFSLDEIGDLLVSDSQSPGIDLLLAKIQQTEAHLRQLLLRRDRLQQMALAQQKLKQMEEISIQKLPSIIVASYRGVIDNYAALGEVCCNVIAPEMARLGCRCPQPGYCFTVEHNKEYRDHDIDIEYCEMVEEMGTDSDLVKFKRLPEVPTAVCFKCYGPYERLYQHYVDAFAYIAKEGYEVAGAPRACYVDGIWNQSDPEKWLTIIQIPVLKDKPVELPMANRLRLFCCPQCGAVTMAYGTVEAQCCHQPLQPLHPVKATPADSPDISEVDGEYLLEYHHPMTKDFYIAAVVSERYDGVEFVRMFPEQESEVRLSRVAHTKLYTVYRQHDKVWATLLCL